MAIELARTRQGIGSPGVMGMSTGVGVKGPEASHGSAIYHCIIVDKSLIFIHTCMHACIHSFIHSTNVYGGLTLG